MTLNCVVLGTGAPHAAAFVYRGMSMCYEHLLKANLEEFSTGGGPSHAWPTWTRSLGRSIAVRRISMDRDFIYRQALLWLEHEAIPDFGGTFAKGLVEDKRKELAESLTNHLWNNWQMVERHEGYKWASIWEMRAQAEKRTTTNPLQSPSD